VKMWRTRCGMDYGPVVTQTTEWIDLNAVWYCRGHGSCRTDRMPQDAHQKHTSNVAEQFRTLR